MKIKERHKHERSKTPKKPLIYYYTVVLLAVMLFNFLAMPWLAEHQIRDADLTRRLLDAGVSTTGAEIEETSFLIQILGWVLPLIIFIGIGQFMSKKMMEKAGASNDIEGHQAGPSDDHAVWYEQRQRREFFKNCRCELSRVF